MKTLEDFDKAFSRFLERHEYDQAQNALYSVVSASFKAGWHSAGGDIIPSRAPVNITPKKPKK